MVEHVCHLMGFSYSLGDECPACKWIAQAGHICRWCERVVDAEHKDINGSTACPAWKNGTHEARAK